MLFLDHALANSVIRFEPAVGQPGWKLTQPCASNWALLPSGGHWRVTGMAAGLIASLCRVRAISSARLDHAPRHCAHCGPGAIVSAWVCRGVNARIEGA